MRIAKGAGNKPAPQKKEEKGEVQPELKPPTNIGGSLFGVKSDTGAAPANPFSNPFSSNSAGKAPANPFASPSASPNPFASPTPAVQVTDMETKAESKDEPKQEEAAEAALPETFASKVRLTSPPTQAQPARPHEPWPAPSAFPPTYPPFSLDAEYETLDAPSTPQIPGNVRLDVDADGGGVDKDNKEVFESSMDKTFQKFADRVGENPEQVLRYEFKGKPLLYSDTDAVGKMLAPHADGAASNAKVKTTGGNGNGMPRCQNCGAERVFEVQLTPHLITELEAEELSIDGMEWGTIILGVCSKDCKPNDVAEGEVGYLEEWVGVQWEEVEARR